MKNSEQSFFIDQDRNDLFSTLKGLDLQELLVEIANFNLSYRSSGLSLPQTVTMGIEIEYEKVLKEHVTKYINKNFPNWDSKADYSISLGGEVTSPILHDNLKTWQELREVCQYLKRIGAKTSQKSGGHIHIGAHILGENMEYWKQFISTYAAYESVLFRFFYGDKLNGRKALMKYASPVADRLYERLGHLDITDSDSCAFFFRTITDSRYRAINFRNVDFELMTLPHSKHTLEFRSPNSTLNDVIWQNNMNVCANLTLAPKRQLIDQEYIDYKLQYERICACRDNYKYYTVQLKNALEFSDIIFQNNLDKVYFLKQYLKNFDEDYSTKKCVKAKKFYK